MLVLVILEERFPVANLGTTWGCRGGVVLSRATLEPTLEPHNLSDHRLGSWLPRLCRQKRHRPQLPWSINKVDSQISFLLFSLSLQCAGVMLVENYLNFWTSQLDYVWLHRVIGLTLPPYDANPFSSAVRLVRALGEEGVYCACSRYRVVVVSARGLYTVFCHSWCHTGYTVVLCLFPLRFPPRPWLSTTYMLVSRGKFYIHDEKLSHIVWWSQLFTGIRSLELRLSLCPIGERGSRFPLLREQTSISLLLGYFLHG